MTTVCKLQINSAGAVQVKYTPERVKYLFESGGFYSKNHNSGVCTYSKYLLPEEIADFMSSISGLDLKEKL